MPLFCRACRHRADQHTADGWCLLVDMPEVDFQVACRDCTGLDAVAAAELFPTARFGAGQAFVGHQPRGCGEHRTTGERAWCGECGEWCYPGDGCIRCRHPDG